MSPIKAIQIDDKLAPVNINIHLFLPQMNLKIHFMNFMTGKMLSIQWFFYCHLFVSRWRYVVDRFIKPATSFTLLEYIIIWCKIQVIINLLLYLFNTPGDNYCRELTFCLHNLCLEVLYVNVFKLSFFGGEAFLLILLKCRFCEKQANIFTFN